MVPPQNRMVPLEVGEAINFNLPFQLNQKFYNQGVIRWQQIAPQGQVCGAQLEKRAPLRYPIYVAFETGEIRFVIEEFGMPSVEHLVERILQDAFYFKKGVGIYFEHLAPYFTRHSLQRVATGSKLPEDIVVRIRARIQGNVLIIGRLKTKAAQRAAAQPFPTMGDLESLRTAIELELNLKELSERFSTSTVLPYLRSVQLLEHQLYSNFNTLVLLYLQISGHHVTRSQERDSSNG
jgi:hypothetical protein